MAIKYFPAPDIEVRAKNICEKVGIKRDFTRIHFLRSRGSAARRTLARCHTTPRILQTALDIKAHYIIEVISEKFDRLSESDQTKTIIHEVMHIPQGMKGGFRHHDFVCGRNVDEIYKNYINSIRQ
jgi:predicted metallopeptidase